jgi:hypothetical protein
MEDQAIFSEVKIEMDLAEPAYWTTQQWTQEQGQGKIEFCFECSLGYVVKPLANEISASEPSWERCKLRQRYHVTFFFL